MSAATASPLLCLTTCQLSILTNSMPGETARLFAAAGGTA